MQQRTMAEEELTVDYFTAIGGFPGVVLLGVEILATAMVLRMLLRFFRRRAQLRGVQLAQGVRSRLSRSEWALLIAGVALAALLYAMDIVYMLE